MGGVEAIKSDQGAWFDPLNVLRRRFREKRGINRVARSVGMKKGVAEAATQLISSTSMQETPIARETITEELQDTVSTT